MPLELPVWPYVVSLWLQPFDLKT